MSEQQYCQELDSYQVKYANYALNQLTTVKNTLRYLETVDVNITTVFRSSQSCELSPQTAKHSGKCGTEVIVGGQGGHCGRASVQCWSQVISLLLPLQLLLMMMGGTSDEGQERHCR